MKTLATITILALVLGTSLLAMDGQCAWERRVCVAITRHLTQELQGLLQPTANVHAVNEEGDSLLHFAAKEDHADAVDLLVGAGVSPDVAGHEQRTPLHTAAWFGSADVAGRLLARGAHTNATECRGNTPLHWACWRGKTEIVRLLLGAEGISSCGGLVSNDELRAPLHLAAAAGHLRIVRLLLPYARGAIDQCDAKGRTAADLARQGGYFDTAGAIEAFVVGR